MATPMQVQYLELKQKYPDCILLFRLGDFYEGFDDDAKTLSRVLGLTLTGRGEAENRIPMAGIPYHALPQYLAKLIKAGFKVAIADQLEEPKPGQLVKRDVTKIVTAGTVIDENTLEISANNYLASIYCTKTKGGFVWGFSFADISTGEFKVAEYFTKGNDIPKELIIELFRVKPAELLLPRALLSEFQSAFPGFYLQAEADESYFVKELAQILLDAFKINSFKAFGINDFTAGIFAAGKLYTYILANRKSTLPHITKIQPVISGDYMLLDEATIRNLELIYPLRDNDYNKTVYGVLNRCQTPMGQRKLRQWLIRPLVKPEAIQQRLDGVEEILKDRSLALEIRNILDSIMDLERVIARISGKSANARDLLFIGQGMSQGLKLIKILQNDSLKVLKYLLPQEESILPLDSKVISLIENAIKPDPALTITDGDIIREGYNKELDTIKNEALQGKEYIKNLENKESKRTGISSLKVKFNKVFGYYIEISRSNLDKVPSDFIRKQTIVNGERYITEELKQWEDKVLNAQQRQNQMEYQIFEGVRAQVVSYISEMQSLTGMISEIDVLSNFAELTMLHKYCKPIIRTGMDEQTRIINSRHPVVETMLPGQFVANDIEFQQDGQQLIILTGPNMSGKSTYIRQVALIFLLAQIGCFVPADTAEIVLTDRIFTRVGASDNLAGGESTFMVEMTETANILNNATEKSLIILDEVGRGTSTYDGMAIAWAIVEYLTKITKARTLFATHYHELLLLQELFPAVKNYNVQVLESGDEISFMHKIVKGGISKSYGIHVAGLAGVPKPVIKRALEVLDQLQKKSIKSFIDKHKLVTSTQLGLMENDHHKAINEFEKRILDLNIDELSPIDALNYLKKIQDDTKHGIE